MDETLMTYLRNIISLEQAVYVGMDDVPEMMKRPAKPRREAGQKTESSRGCVVR